VIEWLAGLWGWIIGMVGVGGLLGAWLRGWLLWLVPVSYPQAGRFLRFRWIELFRWPVVAKQDGRFLALVCCLDGDDAADANTRIVSRALRTEQTLQVVLDWRRIAVGDAAEQTEAEHRARQRADEIGRQYRADLVVWGEVAKSGEGLRLHFQAAGQGVTRDLAVSKGFLDAAHKEPLNSLLGLVAATAALSEVASLTNTGRFVADRLEPLADRLKRALEDPVLDLDPGQRAGLWFSLGVALAQIGEQRGDNAALRAAVAAYRAALEVYTRERAPMQWAMTQNNLGNALQTLGARRGDDDALRAAVAAFRAALEVYTRERVPLQWATTQTNLGNALLTLGKRGDDTALRAAIDAYREALEVYTRERVPLQWATTQNNLGAALLTLGERGDDDALRAAVDAYREALQERTRERVPLQWATTQNNLGNALLTLGERGNDDALREAVDAYRAALEECTRERVPLDWATTQNNLGNALAILGERGDDDALRAAVAAYRAALQECTRERAPMQWARTQENLALALRAQAERSRDAAPIVEALAAIDGAIEEFTKRAAPHDLAKARQVRECIVETARALGLP
jgi:tetratricopeptide (TPR) repeat protein